MLLSALYVMISNNARLQNNVNIAFQCVKTVVKIETRDDNKLTPMHLYTILEPKATNIVFSNLEQTTRASK